MHYLKKPFYICVFILGAFACHSEKHSLKDNTLINNRPIQNKIESLLITILVKHQATSGKVIIMETATGYIKAMIGLERKIHSLRSSLQPISAPHIQRNRDR